MALKGYIGFKGERGYSAYEVAVRNGFKGTEQDWLANLGTSSHFERCSNIYTVTEVNTTQIDIPDCYNNNAFIDVYIEGERLNSDEYTLDEEINKIVLVNAIDTVPTRVEVITLIMSTNSLPIVTTITSSSTNKTTPGTKAVYDLVNPIEKDVDSLKNSTATVTGTIQKIVAGGVEQIDVVYPTGFNKNNCTIIAKLVSSNNVYYDVSDSEQTADGFPKIDMIALTDSAIRVWLKNTNNTIEKDGYFKITLMKI